MIFSWFKGLQMAQKAAVGGIALLVVIAVIVIANSWFDKVIDNAEEKGATDQREGDLQETLKRTEEGNDAREKIRNNVGTARYDQCLRTAREPENCERFLPEQQSD